MHNSTVTLAPLEPAFVPFCVWCLVAQVEDSRKNFLQIIFFVKYTFNALLITVLISELRCLISVLLGLTEISSNTTAIISRIFWLILRFCTINVELILITFPIIFNITQWRGRRKTFLINTSNNDQNQLLPQDMLNVRGKNLTIIIFLISLIYTSFQIFFEFKLHHDNETIISHTSGGTMTWFANGGTMFWFSSTIIFSIIYIGCCLLIMWLRYFVRNVENLQIPNKTFIIYCVIMIICNVSQMIGCLLLIIDDLSKSPNHSKNNLNENVTPSGIVESFKSTLIASIAYCLLNVSLYLYLIFFPQYAYFSFFHHIICSERKKEKELSTNPINNSTSQESYMTDSVKNMNINSRRFLLSDNVEFTSDQHRRSILVVLNDNKERSIFDDLTISGEHSYSPFYVEPTQFVSEDSLSIKTEEPFSQLE
ncbi:hypothetical protein SNEBB_003379 [Seison nebaliae]|nr:hypothetical protein SNEBB_003379 [Seison nebaliae]